MASRAFARGHLVDLLAELLPAVELARICSVSTRFYRHAATLAFASVRAQHGLMIPDASLAEMHALDSVQEAQSFDMRKQGTRRVLRGSPLCTTYVGSYRDKVTLAQIPPAPGDMWSIACPLRRGAYLMTLDGWENPAHGVLDIFLDGRCIARIDWFNDYTTERSRSIDFAVRWTGLHQVVGRYSQTNADAGRPTRHWICLRGVRLRRIAGTERLYSWI